MYIVARYIGVRYIGARYVGASYIGVRYIGARYIGARYIGVRYIGARYIGARYIGVRYIGASYIGVRYIGVRYIGVRYIRRSAHKTYYHHDHAIVSLSYRELNILKEYIFSLLIHYLILLYHLFTVFCDLPATTSLAGSDNSYRHCCPFAVCYLQ